jgi:ribosomal protein L37AE/L43A
MNKIIDWIFYQIKLRQEFANKRYRKEFETLLKQVKKSIKVEEKKSCEHKVIHRVTDTFYECKKCKSIMNLADCEVWEKEKFINGYKELLNKLGER